MSTLIFVLKKPKNTSYQWMLWNLHYRQTHYLWTIKMIDNEDYDLLQKVIRQDIRTPLIMIFCLFNMWTSWGDAWIGEAIVRETVGPHNVF